MGGKKVKRYFDVKVYVYFLTWHPFSARQESGLRRLMRYTRNMKKDVV
ncbi:hypothetical protein [Candidatus Acidianus copahuensis]|nr:hypothetical protein [Candidatus Acidianus copahuensis]